MSPVRSKKSKISVAPHAGLSSNGMREEISPARAKTAPNSPQGEALRTKYDNPNASYGVFEAFVPNKRLKPPGVSRLALFAC